MLTLLATLFLCSCEDDYKTYMPESHWILHVDKMTEGRRLTLTFDGDGVKALDGNWDTRPFTSDRTWVYHIDGNGYMHIHYTTTDSDGDSSTDSYELLHSLSDDGLTMTLVYEPAFGSPRTYRFDRR